MEHFKKPWVEVEVLGQLKQLMVARRSLYPDTKSKKHKALKTPEVLNCRKDSTSLDGELSLSRKTSNRPLQIKKWIDSSYTPPPGPVLQPQFISAELCDKGSSITCEFTSACVEAASYHRGSTGSIIELLEYDLVFQGSDGTLFWENYNYADQREPIKHGKKKGKASKALSANIKDAQLQVPEPLFRIHKFKVLKADESPIFGNPTSLKNHNELKQLLSSLPRKHPPQTAQAADHKGQKPRNKTSQASAPMSGDSDSEEVALESQAGSPARYRPRQGQEELDSSEESISQMTFATQIGQSKSLFAPGQRNKKPSPIDQDMPLPDDSREERNNRMNDSTANEQRKLQTDSTANEQRKLQTLKNPSTSTNNPKLTMKLARGIAGRKSEITQTETTPPDIAPVAGQFPEKLNSSGLPTEKGVGDVSTEAKQPIRKLERPKKAIKMLPLGTMLHLHPGWQGMKEVRKLDVAIPKRQLTMLETESAWYPKEEHLNSHRKSYTAPDDEASMKSPTAHQGSPHHNMSTFSPSQALSDEGSPLSWPPSPVAQDTMPPDSSSIQPPETPVRGGATSKDDLSNNNMKNLSSSTQSDLRSQDPASLVTNYSYVDSQSGELIRKDVSGRPTPEDKSSSQRTGSTYEDPEFGSFSVNKQPVTKGSTSQKKNEGRQRTCRNRKKQHELINNSNDDPELDEFSFTTTKKPKSARKSAGRKGTGSRKSEASSSRNGMEKSKPSTPIVVSESETDEEEPQLMRDPHGMTNVAKYGLLRCQNMATRKEEKRKRQERLEQGLPDEVNVTGYEVIDPELYDGYSSSDERELERQRKAGSDTTNSNLGSSSGNIAPEALSPQPNGSKASSEHAAEENGQAENQSEVDTTNSNVESSSRNIAPEALSSQPAEVPSPQPDESQAPSEHAAVENGQAENQSEVEERHLKAHTPQRNITESSIPHWGTANKVDASNDTAENAPLGPSIERRISPVSSRKELVVRESPQKLPAPAQFTNIATLEHEEEEEEEDDEIPQAAPTAFAQKLPAPVQVTNITTLENEEEEKEENDEIPQAAPTAFAQKLPAPVQVTNITTLENEEEEEDDDDEIPQAAPIAFVGSRSCPPIAVVTHQEQLSTSVISGSEIQGIRGESEVAGLMESSEVVTENADAMEECASDPRDMISGSEVQDIRGESEVGGLNELTGVVTENFDGMEECASDSRDLKSQNIQDTMCEAKISEDTHMEDAHEDESKESQELELETVTNEDIAADKALLPSTAPLRQETTVQVKDTPYALSKSLAQKKDVKMKEITSSDDEVIPGTAGGVSSSQGFEILLPMHKGTKRKSVEEKSTPDKQNGRKKPYVRKLDFGSEDMEYQNLDALAREHKRKYLEHVSSTEKSSGGGSSTLVSNEDKGKAVEKRNTHPVTAALTEVRFPPALSVDPRVPLPLPMQMPALKPKSSSAKMSSRRSSVASPQVKQGGEKPSSKPESATQKALKELLAARGLASFSNTPHKSASAMEISSTRTPPISRRTSSVISRSPQKVVKPISSRNSLCAVPSPSLSHPQSRSPQSAHLLRPTKSMPQVFPKALHKASQIRNSDDTESDGPDVITAKPPPPRAQEVQRTLIPQPPTVPPLEKPEKITNYAGIKGRDVTVLIPGYNRLSAAKKSKTNELRKAYFGSGDLEVKPMAQEEEARQKQLKLLRERMRGEISRAKQWWEDDDAPIKAYSRKLDAVKSVRRELADNNDGVTRVEVQRLSSDEMVERMKRFM